MYKKMTTKNFSFKISVFCCCLITLGFCALMPIDVLQELELKYEAYMEKNPTAKINLVFNQPAFAAGDTAFFSAWYLDEELLAIKGDHIVSLDLLNGNGITVQKIRFKVKNGRAANQMVVRADLPPAEYKFVAYTDWVRNFGDSWFFQKRIQIVSRKKLQTQPQKQNDIAFYPEGGNLIEGLPSKVVVVGPAANELTIRDASQSEVNKVLLDSTGVGSFTITPKPEQAYYVSWPTAEKKWSLPKALSDGLALTLTGNENHDILLSLPANSKWANKEIYAVVSSKGKLVVTKKALIPTNETFTLQIPLREKSDAFHQVFIFDSDKQLLAERVFIPDYQPNKASATLQVSPSARQRQSISFTLGVVDDRGYPVESDLSITVLQKNLFNHTPSHHSFYLSDLPDVMERVEKFGVKDLSALNDFLITKKWERTNWKAILADQTPAFLYPFQSLITLTGTVTSKTSGSPPRDSTAVISYLQKNTVGYEGYTKNGKFKIPVLFDFWGDDQIFCTLQYKSKNLDSDYDIHIAKDSIDLPDRWSSSETTATSAYGEFAFNKQIISKSYSFFGSKQGASVEELGPNSVLEEEFLGADASVKISDYVLFPTMEDLLREIVPFVQFQKKGSRQVIRMSYRYEKSVKVYGDDPLYIIDGLMSRNTEHFLSLKPENLLSIKVINNPNKLSQLGKLGENGILFVESKKRNLSNSLPGNNIFSIAGQSRATTFFETDYITTGKSNRTPDLRSNLYWTPSLKVNKQAYRDVTFFASDDTGPLLIRVEGLTKDGIPFVTVKTVNVEFAASNK